jgi:hypothetical protein
MTDKRLEQISTAILELKAIPPGKQTLQVKKQIQKLQQSFDSKIEIDDL